MAELLLLSWINNHEHDLSIFEKVQSLLYKIITLIFLSCASILVTACQPANTSPVQVASETPRPTISLSTEEVDLPLMPATPHAQQPAAGICAESPGEERVTAEIFIDVPSPRCLRVWSDQTLQVINRTDETVEISLGVYSNRLQPGESVIIDRPLGDYLQPGVHRLLVSPYSGPEIWMVE